MQLTQQLFDHVWGQWCTDTQHIATGLPQALANQVPGQPFLVSLERWLILLKVSKLHMAMLSPNPCRSMQSLSCPHEVEQGHRLLLVFAMTHYD